MHTSKMFLVLVALGALLCSARLTQAGPTQAPMNVATASQALYQEQRSSAPGAEPASSTARSTAEPPAPALLIYLALILLGSALGIGVIWHQHRQQLL